MGIIKGSAAPIDNAPIHPNCKVSQFSLDVDFGTLSRWADAFGEGLRRAEKKTQHKESVPVPQPFYDAFKNEKAFEL